MLVAKMVAKNISFFPAIEPGGRSNQSHHWAPSGGGLVEKCILSRSLMRFLKEPAHAHILDHVSIFPNVIARWLRLGISRVTSVSYEKLFGEASKHWKRSRNFKTSVHMMLSNVWDVCWLFSNKIKIVICPEIWRKKGPVLRASERSC